MLSSIRVQNFRSYEDSGTLSLSKINLFIGENNAGKSALLSAIQLGLTSNKSIRTPLDLDSQAGFASFESVVRRHWRPGVPRPSSFSLTYEWTIPPFKTPPHLRRLSGAHESRRLEKGTRYSARYEFRENKKDGRAYVATAQYGEGGEPRSASVLVRATRRRTGSEEYVLPAGPRNETVFFRGGIPSVLGDQTVHMPRRDRAILQRLFTIGWTRGGGFSDVVVVLPHRPVPRTVYVLDDPNMTTADRELISELMRIWASQTKEAATMRARIQNSLKVLGLARELVISRPLKRGLKVAEVRIAAKQPRQMVTVADVGYGVSQVLPLVTNEAHLAGGVLIAYQPEMHLHPFAQSRLADVFRATAARGNQVFVETHSEHLILRLQYLVAEGDIKPEDVRVFCVEHVENASRVTEMSFNDKGSPTIRWPKGFLDVGLTLASDLARSRAS